MHEYREGTVARHMLKVDSNVRDVDLYIAVRMLAMCAIGPVHGGGSHAGRSLVLGVGQSPFACALGGRAFGHDVVGICFHAAAVHRQNFLRNKLRSRARFTYSTTKDVLLAMPVFNWNFVFVLPYVNWNEISNYVLTNMKDSKIVVAQKLPIDLEDYEHETFRVTKAGYCHPTIEEEEGEWVIFRVR